MPEFEVGQVIRMPTRHKEKVQVVKPLTNQANSLLSVISTYKMVVSYDEAVIVGVAEKMRTRRKPSYKNGKTVFAPKSSEMHTKLTLVSTENEAKRAYRVWAKKSFIIARLLTPEEMLTFHSDKVRQLVLDALDEDAQESEDAEEPEV